MMHAHAINKASTLLAAVMAISIEVAAQAACDPAAGLRFICGLTNAEDLVQVPGTSWIVASGLAEGEHAGGHIYLVNAHDRSVQVLLPGHVAYRQDAETFGACPGAPDEAKFSAHGLSLRIGSDLDGLRRISGRRHGQRRGGVAWRRLRSQQLHQHQRPEGNRQADGGAAGGWFAYLAAKNGVGRGPRGGDDFRG